MSDTSIATEASLPPIQNVEIPGEGGISARDAAAALSKVRWDRAREAGATEMDAAGVAQVQEQPPQQEIPAEQPETPTPQEATGEEPQAAEPAETPKLDLPRSWGKDKSELWARLTPDVQEYLLEQDRTASRSVRQRQNELADQRKAIDAERQQMEQARKQYETQAAQAAQALQQSLMGEFSDIKSMADVQKMANEDWPRFSRYQAKMMEIQQYQSVLQEAQTRQQQEFRSRWDNFAKDEDAKFLELAPELIDETVAKQVADGSRALLHDIGFSDQDLSKLWGGEASVSLRDHRIQLLIRDAFRYREAQKVARSKVAKPVPVVQRPGSPAARAPEGDIREKQLISQFDGASGTAAIRAAAEFISNRRNRR
jgi:hypothetical protein